MENLKGKIHDYLDGTLTAAETQAFETALMTDKDLADEVNLYNDLIKGIEIGADDTLRQSINSVKKRLAAESFFEEDTVEETKKEAIIRTLPNANATENTGIIRRLSIYKWAAAASVLLIVGVAYWLLQSKKDPARFQNEYAQYFRPETQRLNQINEELNSIGFGTDKAQSESLKNALKAYSDKDFTTAKSLFIEHLKKYTNDFTAQFYLSMTFMSLKENKNATFYLEGNLIHIADWSTTAQWYLALNYLTIEGKQEAALSLLTNIANDTNSPYHKEAGEMLKKLQ